MVKPKNKLKKPPRKQIIKIRPEYDTVKSKVRIRPLTYKSKQNVANLINNQIKKSVKSTSNLSLPLKTQQQKTTHEGLSLQSLFLKANEIKNKSSDELKRLRDLNSSDPTFKSLNMQKTVLDKLINSYIEKINGLRVRKGSYTKADENELSLLPSKLQNIEIEYAKLKDIIDGHMKEQNITPEEKTKRTAERLYNKLLEMNQVLDPNTNRKKLSEVSIQVGPDVDSIMHDLNNPNVRKPIIDKFQNMMRTFDEKYNHLQKSIESTSKDLVSQVRKRTKSGENILSVTEIAAFENLINALDANLRNVKAEQEKILSSLTGPNPVQPIQIIKFNINMENISAMENSMRDIESRIGKSIETVVSQKITKASTKTVENIKDDQMFRKVIEIINKVRSMLKLLWEDNRHLISKKSYNYGVGLIEPVRIGNKKANRIDLIKDFAGDVLFLLRNNAGDMLIDIEKIEGDPYIAVNPTKVSDKSSNVYVSYPGNRGEIIKAFIITFKRYDIGYRDISKHIDHITMEKYPNKSAVDETGKFFRNNKTVIETNYANINALEEIYLSVFHKIIRMPKAITREEFVNKYQSIIYEYSNGDYVAIGRAWTKIGPEQESLVQYDNIPDSSSLNQILSDDERRMIELQKSLDSKFEKLEDIEKSLGGMPSNRLTEEIMRRLDEIEKLESNEGKIEKLRELVARIESLENKRETDKEEIKFVGQTAMTALEAVNVVAKDILTTTLRMKEIERGLLRNLLDQTRVIKSNNYEKLVSINPGDPKYNTESHERLRNYNTELFNRERILKGKEREVTLEIEGIEEALSKIGDEDEIAREMEGIDEDEDDIEIDLSSLDDEDLTQNENQ